MYIPTYIPDHLGGTIGRSHRTLYARYVAAVGSYSWVVVRYLPKISSYLLIKS